MAESGETTALDEQQPIERHREAQPSEAQADIPEDLNDKLISGQVSADAVSLENVLDRLNGKLEEQKVAIACHPTARMLSH